MAKSVGSSSGGKGVSVDVVAAGICVEAEIVGVNVGDSTDGEARICCAANPCTGAGVTISSRCMDVLCAAQAETKNRLRVDMILRI